MGRITTFSRVEVSQHDRGGGGEEGGGNALTEWDNWSADRVCLQYGIQESYRDVFSGYVFLAVH